MRPELFTIPGTQFSLPSYGVMVVIAFLGGTWWMTLRASRVKADPDVFLNLGFIALIFGWIGARIFYVVHYWNTQFKHNPLQAFNTCGGGFEVYGGLLLATLVSILYLKWRGLSLRLHGDIVAPSLLFGMGVGRIGCFLFGCCWGGSCPASLPWGVQFPFSSPPHNRQWQNRQVTVPANLIFIDPAGDAGPLPTKLMKTDLGLLDKRVDDLNKKLDAARADNREGVVRRIEKQIKPIELVLNSLRDHYKRFDATPEQLLMAAQAPELRSNLIHPAQLYGAIGPLLMAWLTNAWFYRRKRHGTVFALMCILYAIQRFIEEIIRSDNPLDTLGLTVSQGISIGVLLAGALFWLGLLRQPLRSPRAVPFVPEDKKAKDAVATAGTA